MLLKINNLARRAFSAVTQSALHSESYVLTLYEAHRQALSPAVTEDASRDLLGQFKHTLAWTLSVKRKTVTVQAEAVGRTKTEAKKQACRKLMEVYLKTQETPETAKALVAKSLVGSLAKELKFKNTKRSTKAVGRIFESILHFGGDLQVQVSGISKVSAEIAAYEKMFQLLLDRKFGESTISDQQRFLSDSAASEVLVDWNRVTGGRVEISVQPSDRGFLGLCVHGGRSFQAHGPSKRIAKAHVAMEIMGEEISVSTRNNAAQVKRLIAGEKFDEAYRLFFDKILATGCTLGLVEVFCACLAHDRGYFELIERLSSKADVTAINYATFSALLDAAVTASDAEIFTQLERLAVNETPARMKKLRTLLALERHAQIHQARECLHDLDKFPVDIVSVDYPVIKARRNQPHMASGPRVFGLGSTGQMAVLETPQENFLCEASESSSSQVITLKVPPSQSVARVRKAIAQNGTLVLLGDVETTYVRACEALRLFYAPDSDQERSLVTPPVRAVVVDGQNRQLFAADPVRIRDFAAKYNLSSAQKDVLQSSQEHAVTLVQGAPGAGKTHVSGAIIDLWRATGAKVLVVADSNAAVDNLRGMLKSRGVPCLRVGKCAEVNPEALDLLVGTQLYGEYVRRTSNGTASNSELWFLRRRIEQAAVDAAQVVLATCVGSGHDSLSHVRFNKVLIDEATQSVEPVTLIALTRGCDQVVLIGDHKQLPPTVVSQEAKERGLGLSLFERLTSHEFPLHLLDIQRRMHPSIMAFSNELFYNNRVKSETPPRAVVLGFPWPREECRVCLVQTTSGAEGLHGRSRHNTREGEIVLEIVHNVMKKGLSPKDIGIIVPYNAQRLTILRLIRSLPNAHSLAGLAVNTVDSFQGQEKDLIIFSAVRSNAQGDLGFLDDPRRINVTLTRAKRGLIVIADDQTLARRGRGIWAQWTHWVKAQGSVIHESLVSARY